MKGTYWLKDSVERSSEFNETKSQFIFKTFNQGQEQNDFNRLSMGNNDPNLPQFFPTEDKHANLFSPEKYGSQSNDPCTIDQEFDIISYRNQINRATRFQPREL